MPSLTSRSTRSWSTSCWPTPRRRSTSSARASAGSNSSSPGCRGIVGEDGKLDLRVLLIGGSANGQGSFPISVTIDRLASDAATTSVGPGTLNLLTGDYTLPGG